jgi:ribosomal protein S18 acetylase RimI-like enzyme
MDIPGFDIRYTYVTDLSYLRQWVNSPGILDWFPMTTEKEVEDALQCWIGFCRWSCSVTATVNHVPCAIGTLFLMPYKKVAHHCLFKLIVDPHWQKKGVGQAMVRNLKHLAKHYFHLESISIEAFEGNSIISLLKKNGFEEIFRQEKFVKMNGGYKARVFLEAKL